MPSTDNNPPGPGETVVRRTTTTSYARGVPRLPLLLAALLVPLALTALATLTGIGPRDTIQDDLTTRGNAALAAAGISGATVSFAGRDATVAGVRADQEAAARQAVEGVRGVRVSEILIGGPGTSGPSDSPTTTSAAPAVGDLAIAATATTITLTGQVPDEATRAAMLAEATAKAAPRTVVDQLTVAPGVRTAVAPAGVGALVAALGTGAGDRQVSLSAGTVTLSGAVAAEADGAAAALAAAAAVPGSTVDNKLTVAPPPFDKAAVQQQISAVIAGQQITFEPSSATLTAAGAATVARVAEVLRTVPRATIEVAGHVADTPGTAQNPQTLSDQRAAAVKAALEQLGVPAAAITAKGYAASRPIADNNTPQGQAANRRVEIVVL